MLVEQTHDVRHEWRNNERPMRFTDTRLDEQQREVSLKMVPMSLLLAASSGKSYLMNLIDTPGAPPAFPWPPTQERGFLGVCTPYSLSLRLPVSSTGPPNTGSHRMLAIHLMI